MKKEGVKGKLLVFVLFISIILLVSIGSCLNLTIRAKSSSCGNPGSGDTTIYAIRTPGVYSQGIIGSSTGWSYTFENIGAGFYRISINGADYQPRITSLSTIYSDIYLVYVNPNKPNNVYELCFDKLFGVCSGTSLVHNKTTFCSYNLSRSYPDQIDYGPFGRYEGAGCTGGHKNEIWGRLGSNFIGNYGTPEASYCLTQHCPLSSCTAPPCVPPTCGTRECGHIYNPCTRSNIYCGFSTFCPDTYGPSYECNQTNGMCYDTNCLYVSFSYLANYAVPTTQIQTEMKAKYGTYSSSPTFDPFPAAGGYYVFAYPTADSVPLYGCNKTNAYGGFYAMLKDPSIKTCEEINPNNSTVLLGYISTTNPGGSVQVIKTCNFPGETYFYHILSPRLSSGEYAVADCPQAHSSYASGIETKGYIFQGDRRLCSAAFGVCEPQTCEQLGKECGTWDDGCGDSIECGGCNIPKTCNIGTGQCECPDSEAGFCNNGEDDDCDGDTDCNDFDCKDECCAACDDCGDGLFNNCDATECLSDLGQNLGICDFYDRILINTCVPNATKCGEANAEDTDNDGLLNTEEAVFGTDPNDFDTDNDGLTDYEEVIGGTNPLIADSDGDGLNDNIDPNPNEEDVVQNTLTDSCYKINDDYFWVLNNQFIEVENNCLQTIDDKDVTCCPRGKTCEECDENFECIFSGTIRCSDYKTESQCNNYDANIAAYSVEEMLNQEEGFCQSELVKCKCSWKADKCDPKYELFTETDDGDLVSQQDCSYDSEESECQAGVKTISYLSENVDCTAPSQILASCNVPTEIPFVSVLGLVISSLIILVIYSIRLN